MFQVFSLRLGIDESLALNKLAEMSQRRRGDYLRRLILSEAKRRKVILPAEKFEQPQIGAEVSDGARE